MNHQISIQRAKNIRGVVSALPASKSISNRALIIDALAGGTSKLENLSDANDTQLMIRLLNAADEMIDVEDAGTTMRFLTAFFAITNKTKVMTGTARMKERPIGILVDALRTLGADIRYLEKEGYPPLRIHGFKAQLASSLRIRGDVSSQFISALMMIGPLLPEGLSLTLEGKVGSRPYIEMTAALMKHFGAGTSFTGDTIHIGKQAYKTASFTVESDWSAASYWLAFTALCESAELLLPRLNARSLQGDHVVVQLLEPLGVRSEFLADGQLRLTKGDVQKTLRWDFTHCPDLAQTAAVVCAAKGVRAVFSGLESLRIKETDRIAALQNELRKIGGDMVEDGGTWTIVPSAGLPGSATFETYHDHRMAMAFAPLAALMDVRINDPSVVRKSYPAFWEDVRGAGFKVVDGNAD